MKPGVEMISRNKYPAPAPPVPKTPSAIAPISDNKLFAAAADVLRMLQDGAEGLQRQLDVLRLEDFVGDVGKLARDPRKLAIQARLTKLKADAPKPAAAAVQTGHPPAVAAGLELLASTTPVTRRTDRRALVAQLEDDRDTLRLAICEQHQVVDGIRDSLSAELARKLEKSHRTLIVQQFRHAQALAHSTDQLRALYRSVSEGGFTARPDILRGTPGRACLILGSESVHDSEVSRMRVTLEEMGAL
jgi:hypothetical protein